MSRTKLVQVFQDIADGIRANKGTTNKMKPEQFGDEVRSIPSALEVVNLMNGILDGSIEEITLHEKLTSLKDYAFSYSNNLKKITLPSTLKTIGNYVFYECAKLNEIIIEDGVESIGNNFVDTTKNTNYINLTFPESIKNYGNNVLYRGYFNSVYLPFSILNIAPNKIFGDYAYTNNIYCNFTKEEYANSNFKIQPIGNYDKSKNNIYFKNNGEYELLTEVTINQQNNQELKYRFFYSLLKATIKSDVETIANSILTGCSFIKNVIIEEGVKELGPSCFNQCTFSELTIPSTITKIGSGSLPQSYSEKLTLIMKPTTPPIMNATINTYLLNKIFVPIGTKATYVAATNWSKYADYIFEPNEHVDLNINSSLLNNANYLYSIDQGSTWNQFTSSTMNLQYINTIWFKNLVADTTIKIGTSAGGSEIGTIANAELKHTTSANEVIYLSV